MEIVNDWPNKVESETLSWPIFTNSKPTLCPVDTCKLYKNTCSLKWEALESSYDANYESKDKITIETIGPDWKIKVKRNEFDGYKSDNLCMVCRNKKSTDNHIQ